MGVASRLAPAVEKQASVPDQVLMREPCSTQASAEQDWPPLSPANPFAKGAAHCAHIGQLWDSVSRGLAATMRNS
jgi:hypothetical protein